MTQGTSKPRFLVFSGHRNVPTDDTEKIRAAVRAELKSADAFYCGGAVGADLTALGEAVRVKRGGADLRIWVLVADTLKEQPHHARKCIEMVRKEIEMEEFGFPYCAESLLYRNWLLVDKARIYSGGRLLVYWDGKPGSGTYSTVRYASKKGVSIINCHPSAAVLSDAADSDLHLPLDMVEEAEPETENPKP